MDLTASILLIAVAVAILVLSLGWEEWTKRK